jgi:hypothetical protein
MVKLGAYFMDLVNIYFPGGGAVFISNVGRTLNPNSALPVRRNCEPHSAYTHSANFRVKYAGLSRDR